MPVYVWKGRTVAGEIQTGELTLDSQDEALTALRKRRIIISSVREKKAEVKFRLPKLGGGVTTRDLAIFTRQFATMINAGLPLVQCLDILTKQTEKEGFSHVIGMVMRDVEAGTTLAEALGKKEHSKVFDELFVNMVEAGEAGGILDNILQRLATYIEKAEALKRKIKGAMVYPAVVLSVAVLATSFMLIFIIPTFARMFSGFGAELPLPTKIVMGLSSFLRAYWWALVGGMIAAVVGIQRYYLTEKGRIQIDTLLLKIPVLGDVLRKGAVARFTRTLSTLISSGVPILNGLDITARTSGNRVIENAIMAARVSIREGETISAPLRQSSVFPPMVVQMISVGEETGALDDMLTRIADFYDDEVDTAVDSLTSLIEPIMIVIMGTIVGGMVIAMYLPMFKLINVVAGGH
ncbi:MAG: type II secretion system F family protein [Candidatus Eisenbacteria bacterium]|uniref:Type II secretion system F family protein n=1 Tax=Eiseniibacteriota bacterium TaxID=2212470 RepID=A0A538SQI6_UNCEI|nr:MAG: type II secretion system F family protein [Candidatus Eisenbacteria bacterium]TMQ62531.1 MAG: type II secretion system F family protein [Candidatus Eisenbacteria bacterium]